MYHPFSWMIIRIIADWMSNNQPFLRYWFTQHLMFESCIHLVRSPGVGAGWSRSETQKRLVVRPNGSIFLRKFQQTPGTYPRYPKILFFFKDFLHKQVGSRVWGMFQGYVGDFLATKHDHLTIEAISGDPEDWGLDQGRWHHWWFLGRWRCSRKTVGFSKMEPEMKI